MLISVIEDCTRYLLVSLLSILLAVSEILEPLFSLIIST